MGLLLRGIKREDMQRGQVGVCGCVVGGGGGRAERTGGCGGGGGTAGSAGFREGRGEGVCVGGGTHHTTHPAEQFVEVQVTPEYLYLDKLLPPQKKQPALPNT